MSFPIKTNPENLGLSYKTDLDFQGCFRKEKPQSYNLRHMVYAYLIWQEPPVSLFLF